QGDNGDAGGEDIARSLATSESVHAGIRTGAGIKILAVVRYAGCGGGVAADPSVSNGSVSSADGAWSAAVVPALAPPGQAYNLERVVPEERPLHMGPLAS
nr:hypothetical protein [Tanacetum cinerariifolium]